MLAMPCCYGVVLAKVIQTSLFTPAQQRLAQMKGTWCTYLHCAHISDEKPSRSVHVSVNVHMVNCPRNLSNPTLLHISSTTALSPSPSLTLLHPFPTHTHISLTLHTQESMATALQTGGFVLGLLGGAAIIAATGMNNWSVKDRQGDVVTSVYTYKGLWQNCEVGTSGFTECRPLYGLLGFSGTFQAVRALMIVGIVLGVIGAMIALFSLKCLKMGSMEDSSKAKMTLTAGVMFIIAGICAIAGASIYANQIVASFMMTTYNPNYGGGMGQGIENGGSMMPRYTFGPALFVAWIGAALLLLGGILKCVAFRGLQPDKSTNYTGVAYKASQAQNRPVYDDHHAVDGKRDNQKYV
ncbi:claudin-18 [Oncorhynchus mykiss]|uniref:Claudin 18 n=1 Tax=Oncorhynchus mykiss TaxID=8022 RepID=A0A8C7UFW0_ONCMY|nr:claudin-18 [Oncorhynchus mykiss]